MMKDEIRRGWKGQPYQVEVHILVMGTDRFIQGSCIGVHYRVAPDCHNIDSVAGNNARGRCQEVNDYGLGFAV